MNHHPIFSIQSPPATDFVACLSNWAQQRAAQPAFLFLNKSDEVTQVTYSELDRKARAIAVRLTALGLKGERALLYYPPGLDFIEAFFGCLYAGTIAVPALPPRRNRNMPRIEAISIDSRAAIVLTVQDVNERSISLLDDDAAYLRTIPWLATDQVALDIADCWRATKLDDETLAVLQYTSGSTGRPKGVMLSHANLLHNCSLITQAFNADQDSIGLSWLPTYHDMGLVGGILNPVFIGRPNIFMSPMSFLQRPIRWLQNISRFRVSISGAPNFAYALCTEKINDTDCEGLDLSSWTVAFNGAEPVRADTLAVFSEKFKPYGFRDSAFFPCYGMAESTLIISGADRQQPGEATIVGRNGAVKTATVATARVADTLAPESIQAWLINRIAKQLNTAPSKIDVEETFAYFGLDSLTLVGISGELEDWLGHSIAPQLLFIYPTIAELSNFLATSNFTDSSSRVPVQTRQNDEPVARFTHKKNELLVTKPGKSALEILDGLDEMSAAETVEMLKQLLRETSRQEVTSGGLSYGQSALWFIYHIDRTSSAYNIMYATQVHADLDRDAFCRAFQAIVNRHAVLRTTYAMVDGLPEQQVHPYRKFVLQTVDARSWSHEELDAGIQSLADAAFDLEQGPVLRVQLLERSDGQHVMLFVVHHIAFDYWSFDLLVDELETLYREETNGSKSELPIAAVTYWEIDRKIPCR